MGPDKLSKLQQLNEDQLADLAAVHDLNPDDYATNDDLAEALVPEVSDAELDAIIAPAGTGDLVDAQDEIDEDEDSEVE